MPRDCSCHPVDWCSFGLKPGDPLNSYSCDEARRKIEELYHTKGNPTATVTLLEGDQPGDKDLVFLINEGQIERIAWVSFAGNTVASDARLKTQIESKPGFLWYFFKGKVDRTKIDSDVEKITAYYRSLGYFRARVGRELSFDDSGKWLYRSGLPAKSGVGGGLVAVSPGKFGIAVVSPPLDDAGNSVRAQRAIIDISNALNGNPYASSPKP